MPITLGQNWLKVRRFHNCRSVRAPWLIRFDFIWMTYPAMSSTPCGRCAIRQYSKSYTTWPAFYVLLRPYFPSGFSLCGVGRDPGISFNARPAGIGHARPFRGRERVGHHLDAFSGVEPHVCDDHVSGDGCDGKAERVSEALGFELHRCQEKRKKHEQDETRFAAE